MPRLAGKELLVEVAELGGAVRGQRFEEQLEPLAGSRLDERADQQAVDEGRKLGMGERAGRAAQPRGITVDRRRAEGEAASFEEREAAVEMGELLLRELGERADEPEVERVADDERERVRRRLHLAVRVVDEDLVEPGDRPTGPLRIGADTQAKHRLRT